MWVARVYRAGLLGLCVVAALGGCGWTVERKPEQPPAPGAQYQGTVPQPDARDDRARKAAAASRDCGAEIRESSDLHLSLIEEMLDRGLFHAALAHLDALDAKAAAAPRARYLRAEALRRGGDVAQAQAVYTGLLDTCLGGLGHFGLGRIAAAQCSLDKADRELEQARQMRPVDARIVNDLGMVRFARRDYARAAESFRTAVELTRGEGPAMRNLLHVLVVQQQWAQAEQVARRFSVNLAEIEALREAPVPYFGCAQARAQVP